MLHTQTFELNSKDIKNSYSDRGDEGLLLAMIELISYKIVFINIVSMQPNFNYLNDNSTSLQMVVTYRVD